MNTEIYNKKVEYIGLPTNPSTPEIIGLSAGARSISCATFNINATGTVNNVDKKVDILFYNRVNSAGKTITSAVYISPIKQASDIGVITYSPYSMYSDFDFSNFGSSIKCCNNFSWFNTVRIEQNQTLTYIDPYIEEIYSNKYPMNIVQGIGMIDGWYTLVSVGISNSNEQLTVGSLYKDVNDNLFIVTGEDTFKPLKTVLDTDTNLYLKYLLNSNDISQEQGFPQFIRLEFFVIDKLASMVNSLIVKDIKEMYDSLSKLSAIKYSALIGRFDLAQLIVQSEEFKLIQNGI